MTQARTTQVCVLDTQASRLLYVRYLSVRLHDIAKPKGRIPVFILLGRHLALSGGHHNPQKNNRDNYNSRYSTYLPRH